MLSDACRDLGLPLEQVVMVGDTMATDILGAVQLGLRSILVLTGSTRIEDLSQFAYKPDVVVDSIAKIDLELLENLWAVEADGLARELQTGIA